LDEGSTLLVVKVWLKLGAEGGDVSLLAVELEVALDDIAVQSVSIKVRPSLQGPLKPTRVLDDVEWERRKVERKKRAARDRRSAG
jgi:hypothetical protein